MQEDNLYVRVDDLWFQDGNLVIRADNKIFKVTKSIVAARSSVFRDMVAFPQPDTPNDLGGEKIDGCTVVVLHDLARDVEAFLRAIFDSSYFMPPPDTADIHDILGILRLSHKYDVQYLHRRALRHLEGQLYFQSIQAFRNCKEDLDIVDSGVLAAVHEVSALWLLPIAYYKACFFAPATSTQLQTEHHSQQCLKARLDLAREHVVSIAFLKRSGANATCMLPRECNTARLAGLELYFEYVDAGPMFTPCKFGTGPNGCTWRRTGCVPHAYRRHRLCIPTRSTSSGTGFRLYSICHHGRSCTR